MTDNNNNNVLLPTRTRWQVITGAPCAGKTAVIEELALRGHRVIPETARAYIDAQLAAGLTLDRIKADRLAFERHILLAKAEIEQALPPDDLVFLDRALPDSIAYFAFEGLDTVEPLLHGRKFHYANIFFMERLQFEKDAARAESAAGAAQLDDLLRQAYRQLGYPIIEVPVMSIAQRVELILDCVAT